MRIYSSRYVFGKSAGSARRWRPSGVIGRSCRVTWMWQTADVWLARSRFRTTGAVLPGWPYPLRSERLRERPDVKR